MNMNEVLANRASELLGGVRGMERKVHPNDDVNKSQSSNDVFPTAMHVAAIIALREALIPRLRVLKQTLSDKATAFNDIVNAGTGVLRLGSDAGTQSPPSGAESAAPERAGVGRYGRWHRSEHPSAICRTGSGGAGGPQRSAVRHCAEQV